MKGGFAAFGRANAMMAAISVIIKTFAGNFAAQRQALDAMGPYKSRGKAGKTPHRRGNGSARVRRAALKASNRRAHRAKTR